MSSSGGAKRGLRRGMLWPLRNLHRHPLPLQWTIDIRQAHIITVQMQLHDCPAQSGCLSQASSVKTRWNSTAL